MSSATLSPSTYHQSGLSFARQGREGQTPSSAAADEALRRVVAKRRERDRSRRSPPPRDSAIAGLLGGLTASIAGSKDRGVVIRQAFKAVVLGAVAIILATATTRIIMGGRSLAGVAGTVRVGDALLAHGILEFHLRNTAGLKASFQTVVHTDAAGAFRRSPAAGLPRGTYAVVVKAGRSGKSRGKNPAAIIPDRYATAASSPLSVEVTGASAAFDLVVQP